MPCCIDPYLVLDYYALDNKGHGDACEHKATPPSRRIPKYRWRMVVQVILHFRKPSASQTKAPSLETDGQHRATRDQARDLKPEPRSVAGRRFAPSLHGDTCR